MVDHIITRKWDFTECIITRVMQGAQCNTDHIMQRMTFVATVRSPVRKTDLVTKRINVTKLQTEPEAVEFCEEVSAGLMELYSGTDMESPGITREWAAFS